MKTLQQACIGLLALAACVFHAAQAQPLAADEFRVTLLGTGSPAPIMKRFGPGVLVQAGGKNLLIDAGRGVTQRPLQCGVTLGKVDALFVTHLHSDHVVGIPDLWLTGWLEASYAQRKGPFVAYGPTGTQGLMDGLVKAYDWDVKARIADQGLKPEAIAAQVTEIQPGVVYDQGGIKVTAIEVDHGEKLTPAFGYRIDHGGRSVTISGDTRLSENLIDKAAGTDLLIHQVAAASEALLKIPTFRVILAHHTQPEEAATVFNRGKPKLAVYYHFVLLGVPGIPALSEKEVFAATRKT
ncbi:MAG: MBL fold metallo-hydrolase [Rubrivivax sp.]|nr:MBL fold metallo-hydrolase [Rubrivivax sp.]